MVTTSGSVDFRPSRNDLIKGALRHIGVGVTGETPSNEEISDATFSLNLMLKAWMAEGVHLWKRKELSISLTESKAKYLVGRGGSEDVTNDRPIKVLSAIREHTDGGVASMDQLSYDEWWNLPNKSTEAIPTEFFFQPPVPDNEDLAEFHFWPTPDSTAASDWTMKFIVQTPTEDADSGTDDLDIPPYYMEAAMYGLAYRLAPQYGLPIGERQQLARDTNIALQRALDWDMEWGSMYIQPDWEGRLRSR